MASTAALLETLTDAINSATTAFPADETTLLPPAEGISLLDVKNELLLSYLQNLVFLIILRLRNGSEQSKKQDAQIDEEVIKKLIELRVYMEKGVRPLEGRLRYQINNVLRAAEEFERGSSHKRKVKKNEKTYDTKKGNNSSDDSNASSPTSSAGGSENDSDAASEMDDGEETQMTIQRPKIGILKQQMLAEQEKNKTSARKSTASVGGGGGSGGIYKPPRITPTAMPLPQSSRDHDRDDNLIRRRRKANLVDEYIDEEVSSAPRAQPSIGSNSTILAHGRGGLSARDREKQRERLAYEEKNFVRLPAESKAERRKAKARGERERRDMFGGEDWTGLGGLGDRINKSVSSSGGGRSGPGGVLERREKRKRATEDGPRGDGMSMGIGMGEAFDRRKKIMEDRAERKRRKRT